MGTDCMFVAANNSIFVNLTFVTLVQCPGMTCGLSMLSSLVYCDQCDVPG